mgnify:CR=1 FL=1
MKLIVSYHLIGPNWYVGVFYEKFFNYLKTSTQCIPLIDSRHPSVEVCNSVFIYPIKSNTALLEVNSKRKLIVKF